MEKDYTSTLLRIAGNLAAPILVRLLDETTPKGADVATRSLHTLNDGELDFVAFLSNDLADRILEERVHRNTVRDKANG